MFGRKARIERMVKMEARIKQLEHIICPGEQHEYCKASEEMHIIDAQGSTTFTRRYVCKRCGKEITREGYT